MDPIKDSTASRRAPFTYVQEWDRERRCCCPSQNTFTLGENMGKVPSKTKQKLPKDVTDFAAGVWNCLKGSKTCGDTATIFIASGFVLMDFQIHRDNSDGLKP